MHVLGSRDMHACVSGQGRGTCAAGSRVSGQGVKGSPGYVYMYTYRSVQCVSDDVLCMYV